MGADGSLGENAGCGSIGEKLGDKIWLESVGDFIDGRIDGARLGKSDGMALGTLPLLVVFSGVRLPPSRFESD